MKIKGERLTPLDVALRKNNGHLAKFLHLYGGKPASKLNKTLSKQQSTVRMKTKRLVIILIFLKLFLKHFTHNILIYLFITYVFIFVDIYLLINSLKVRFTVF